MLLPSWETIHSLNFLSFESKNLTKKYLLPFLKNEAILYFLSIDVLNPVVLSGR
jgi:hypothetical protein